jgi:hypothetical protein
MDHSITHEAKELVENLRQGGYRGQDPWIAQVPPRMGTCIVALRLYEISAEQIASLWLDGGMDVSEVQHTIRDCFLSRARVVAALFEQSCPDSERPFSLERLIEQFDVNHDEEKLGKLVVSNLLAAMALRQLYESMDVANAAFVPRSSNVHTDFLARCIDKSRWIPFADSPGASLTDFLAQAGASFASGGINLNSSRSLVS